MGPRGMPPQGPGGFPPQMGPGPGRPGLTPGGRDILLCTKYYYNKTTTAYTAL